MNKKNNSLKVNKRKNLKGTKRNRKGGQLSLPGVGSFNFAGSDLAGWANGLGVPAVLVGVRQLMKGSKKNGQKGGSRKNKSLRRRLRKFDGHEGVPSEEQVGGRRRLRKFDGHEGVPSEEQTGGARKNRKNKTQRKKQSAGSRKKLQNRKRNKRGGDSPASPKPGDGCTRDYDCRPDLTDMTCEGGRCEK